MRGKRTRIGKGLYRDSGGYSVIWRAAGTQHEKRFPPDTPLRKLKKYRARQLGRASWESPSEPRSSLTRDAVRFLQQRRGRPSFESDRSHLRVWIHRFKGRSRFDITRDDIRDAVQEWHQAGYSARELRHRCRLLDQLFRTIDPENPSPCVGLKLPRVQKTRPRSVSESVVREVALNLRKQEIAGRLWDAKTRARYLVLATTGQRPAQLRRATLQSVDMEQRIWFVDPAKGDNGATIYLNDDMYAAWSLFIAADAWGDYDSRSFVKTLYRNGWPKGTRPYTLRHRIGLTLSELGVDLGDIQAHMGHSSPATTRQFYVPGVPERQRAASLKLDGRFPTAAFTVPAPRAMNASPQDAKHRKRPPILHARPDKKKGRSEG